MEENTKVGYQRCAHQHSIFMTLEITCWPCNYMFDYEKGIESEKEPPQRGYLFWTSFFFRFPAIVLSMLGLAPSNNHQSVIEVMSFFPSATSLIGQTQCMHKLGKISMFSSTWSKDERVFKTSILGLLSMFCFYLYSVLHVAWPYFHLLSSTAELKAIEVLEIPHLCSNTDLKIAKIAQIAASILEDTPEHIRIWKEVGLEAWEHAHLDSNPVDGWLMLIFSSVSADD